MDENKENEGLDLEGTPCLVGTQINLKLNPGFMPYYLWVNSRSEWRRQCFINPIEWLRRSHVMMQVTGMTHSRNLLEVGLAEAGVIFFSLLKVVK